MALDTYANIKRTLESGLVTIDRQFKEFQSTLDSKVASQLQQEISNIRWDVDDLEKALNDIKSNPERYRGMTTQDIDSRQAYISQTRQKLTQIQNSINLSKSSKGLSAKADLSNLDTETKSKINEIQRQEQTQIMKEQDEILDRFHVTVNQIGNMSRTIGGELEDQNRILEEFDYEVDDTRTRLSTATKYVDKLIEAVSNNKSWCTILILFLILVIVIIIAIAL